MPKSILLGLAGLFVTSSGIGVPASGQSAQSQAVIVQPENGSRLVEDPPFFLVEPGQGARQYRVSLARDSSLVDDRREVVSNLPILTLAEALGAGTWYWRYENVDPQGEVIYASALRTFTVEDNATRLPLPEVDSILSSIPRSRPRLFVTSETLQMLRQRARTESAPELETLLRQANKEIGTELPPESPILRGKGTARGKQVKGNWEILRPHLDRMERLGLAYLVTDDERFGQEARRHLLHFLSWDPQGTTSLSSNDEAATWLMMRSVRVYDWIHDVLTPSEIATIERSFRVRARQFYSHLRYDLQYHLFPENSHAARVLCFLGETSIAFAHEWPEAEEYLDYVLAVMWSIYPPWAGTDGGWHEGPSYWSYYMDFTLHFAVALRNSTGLDLLRRPIYQTTADYKLVVNPPYSKISPFGDGEHRGPTPRMGQVMYWFGALLNRPEYLWYSEQLGTRGGASILGLLLSDRQLKSVAPKEGWRADYFAGVGLVSVHTDFADPDHDIHFQFRSSPRGSYSHAHPDHNSFTIEAGGQPLAIAAGYYPWYGSEHHKSWQWTSSSANTVTLDGGIGQLRGRSASGAIEFFHSEAGAAVLLGNATRAYGGAVDEYRRLFVMLEGGQFVIFDRLAAKTHQRFQWNLHALDQMLISENSREVTGIRPGATVRYRFIEPEELDFRQYSGTEWPPEDGSPPQWHVTVQNAQPTRGTRFLVLGHVVVGGSTDEAPTTVTHELLPECDIIDIHYGSELLEIRVRNDDYQVESDRCGNSDSGIIDVRRVAESSSR